MSTSTAAGSVHAPGGGVAQPHAGVAPADADGGRAPGRVWTRDLPYASVFHGGYLLAFSVFLIAQPFIRVNGGVVFWVFIGITLAYVLLTARPVVVVPLLGFTVVGLVYMALSYVNVLPDAWTQYYARSMIARQAFYVVLLYPLVLAAACMWSHAGRSGRTSRYFLVILISVAVVTPLYQAYIGEGLAYSYSHVLTLGLGNARLLFYMSLTYVLFVAVRNPAISRALVMFVTAAILASFFFVFQAFQIQNVIALFAILVVGFVLPRRKVLIACVLLGFVAYAALTPFATRVYEKDANSGYRLIVAKDAIRAVVGSYGLGVGYGKEVITGIYNEYGIASTARWTDPATLLTGGVHNSFAQEFMRLGVMGGVFLVWLFVFTCAPPDAGPVRVRRHLAAVYLLLLASLVVNVGLESPTYLVGIAFATAYILVTKDVLPESREGH